MLPCRLSVSFITRLAIICGGDYGFFDAFNLSQPWFDNQYLAIDQGPQIIMIENYRSGLLWRLFMSCGEVQQGLMKLGFTIH